MDKFRSNRHANPLKVEHDPDFGYVDI